MGTIENCIWILSLIDRVETGARSLSECEGGVKPTMYFTLKECATAEVFDASGCP
jgi:hypothetical protein